MANHTSADRGERVADGAPKPSPAPSPEPVAAARPDVAARGEATPSPERPLTVERLTHLDVNEVCGLYKRVWDSQKGELLPEMIKAWEPSPLEFTSWMEGVNYFAARKNGRLIGVIGLEIAHGSGRLVHLAVDPETRRQKVATGLVQATIDWARRSNCLSVWADVLARFSAAQALFKHLGFQEAGTLHRHQWSEDVLFFERLL
ncbi:MAG: GNAT family N-acetyltransferase [Thermoplasmata archaeon]